MPEFLADVGHERMDQHQQLLNHQGQNLLGRAAILRIVAVEAPLEQFNGPIAHVVPGKFIEDPGRFPQAVGVQLLCHGPTGAYQTGEDPAICDQEFVGIRLAKGRRGGPIQIEEGKTGGVPQLVGKVSRYLDSIGCLCSGIEVQTNVLPRSGHAPHQGKAQGVCPVTLTEHQGINAIAGGFAHLAVLGVPHQSVDVHIGEGNGAGADRGHHGHAGHPEEDDVESREQGAVGIPAPQIGTLLIRPAHGGERPKGAGEPGVQHVFILLNCGVGSVTAPGLVLGFGCIAGHHVGCVAAQPGAGFTHHKPGWNAMAPPQLTTDAPVADLGEPILVYLGPALGNKAGASLAQGGQAGIGQRFGAHKPLGGKQWLHRNFAPVRVGNSVAVIFHFHQGLFSGQGGHNGVPRLEALQATELSRSFVHAPVLAHDRHQRQTMALTYGKVVGVMGRSHFYAAGAELGIHVIIGNHRNLATHKG